MDKGNRKIKLLLIKDYIERFSDESQVVTADILMDFLKEKGIVCERKSVYTDIAALKDYGMDIDASKRGYRLLSRDFELPELRLLIDAVQSAGFITVKKSKELIKKIETLCSEEQAKILEKQVYIDSCLKMDNEEIYYNIDLINKAISQGKMISFIYRKRKIDEATGEIVFDEKLFSVSPYALIWSNDHYYLVSNNAKYDNLMHTRIDRMKRVSILEQSSRSFSEVSPYRGFFDSADYSGKLFNMFGGDIQRLTLCCDNSILEEIADRFGVDCKLNSIKPERENTFIASTRCVFSEGLISWIMQFGSKIEVLSPSSLRDNIRRRAEDIRNVYSN